MDWKVYDLLKLLTEISNKSPMDLANEARSKLAMIRSGTGLCNETWNKLTLRVDPSEQTRLPDSVSDTQWIKLLRKKIDIACTQSEVDAAIRESVCEKILE